MDALLGKACASDTNNTDVDVGGAQADTGAAAGPPTDFSALVDEQHKKAAQLHVEHAAAADANGDAPAAAPSDQSAVKAAEADAAAEESSEEALIKRARLLFEYLWPAENGDSYFLQEQLAEFLGVKSFKRKYAELSRRQVTPAEREHATAKGHAIGLQLDQAVADIGLTALRSVEVLDLLARDYPAHLAAYKKVVAERVREQQLARAREYASIKHDEKRLAELRRRAMRSASEWTSGMNRERRAERAKYWDMATMSIQVPANSYGRPGAEQTAAGSYPAALLVAQNAESAVAWGGLELSRYPMRTVTDASRLQAAPARAPSPPAVRIAERELTAIRRTEESWRMQSSQRADAAAAALAQTSQSEAAGPSQPTPAAANGVVAKTETADGAEHGAAAAAPANSLGECSQCALDCYVNDRWLRCSQCKRVSHASCLEMQLDIYAVCKTYDWQCMECKPCSVCRNLDQEDKMMFCDRCDRGYHTFCVGLVAIPDGRWICKRFCNDSTTGQEESSSEQPAAAPTSAAEQSAAREDVQAAAGEPPAKKAATPFRRGQQVEFGECAECRDKITRHNKVHHRSKYRHEAMCYPCVKKKYSLV